MSVPVGTVIAYMGLLNTWDKDWLLCDGGSYPIKDKPKLFDVLQFTYGSDQGLTIFKVPDLRGFFLRGVTTDKDRDPDYASRTNPAGGDGPAPGQVGSRQKQELLKHGHNWDYRIRVQSRWDSGDTHVNCWATDPATVPYTPVLITNNDGGGNETRPVNVYVYYLIYAGPTTS
jgi:hypothetical protein